MRIRRRSRCGGRPEAPERSPDRGHPQGGERSGGPAPTGGGPEPRERAGTDRRGGAFGDRGAADADRSLYDADLRKPHAIVLGGEGTRPAPAHPREMPAGRLDPAARRGGKPERLGGGRDMPSSRRCGSAAPAGSGPSRAEGSGVRSRAAVVARPAPARGLTAAASRTTNPPAAWWSGLDTVSCGPSPGCRGFCDRLVRGLAVAASRTTNPPAAWWSGLDTVSCGPSPGCRGFVTGLYAGSPLRQVESADGNPLKRPRRSPSILGPPAAAETMSLPILLASPARTRPGGNPARSDRCDTTKWCSWSIRTRASRSRR